jgi:anti-anti-sigma factor
MMTAAPKFEIDVSPEADGRRRLAVSGELDLATVAELREAVRSAAAAAREVLLDLREITFIDSTGLTLLVNVDAESRADGFGLAIVPGPAVRRLAVMCALQDVLPLRDEA